MASTFREVDAARPRSQSRPTLESFMQYVVARNPGEPEFHQAVREVMVDAVLEHPQYPRRRSWSAWSSPSASSCSACRGWTTSGEVQVNRGYRVEFNSAIGPYKGGLRFHPTRQPRHPQVPRFRADLQEQPHDAADGRRQGRLRLRSQGQERPRGDALLPELHDRALPPHRPGHRRAGGRHRRRRARDRLPVRPVQAARETSSPACSPARAWTGAAA